MKDKGFCKVLLVDDEKLLRDALIYMNDWNERGYIIDYANNGLEALNIIPQFMPNIVVTDIRMPEMNGVELTRMIKERYPFIEVVVLSAFDDFEFVKETLKIGASDYILKPKIGKKEFEILLDSIRERLDLSANIFSKSEQQELISLSLIKSLVLSNSFDEAYFSDRINSLSLPLSANELCLTIIEEEYASRDVSVKKHIMIEKFNSYGIQPCYFELPAGRSVVIYNFPQDRLSELEKLLSSISQVLVAKSNSSISISFRTGIESFCALSKQYPLVVEALDERFFLGRNCLINAENYHQKSIKSHINLTEMDTIFRSLKREPLMEFCRKWLSDICISGSNDSNLLKKDCEFFIYYAIQGLSNQGIDTARVEQMKLSFFKSIEESGYLEDLFEIMNDIIASIYDNLSEDSDDVSHPVIQRMMNYVGKHLSEEVSLSSVAAALHHNPTYISKIFKIKTGMRFTEYLNKVRIERAKELFDNGEHSVSEVCQKVGYSDMSYFGKVFRQFAYISPSEYLHSIHPTSRNVEE